MSTNKKFYFLCDKKLRSNPLFMQMIAKLTELGYKETNNIEDADIAIHPTTPEPVELFVPETHNLSQIMQAHTEKHRTYNAIQQRNARRAYERAYHTRTKHLNEKYVKHK